MFYSILNDIFLISLLTDCDDDEDITQLHCALII